ncbi:glycosyl hydrolase [Frondihabitans cladoniiphilus]|uniref:D-mannose binding lectin n=1 Tax=Frondihabitans cladoniiphilus TaxID=715785 RepID=A0ABP8VYS1_9MICO
MKKTARISIAALALATIVSPIVWTGHSSATADTVTSSAASSATTELSGASGTGVVNGQFAAASGNQVGIAGTWSDNDSASVNFWQLQSGGDYANWNKPLDIAVGAIDAGETWQAAASGAYDARWTTSLTKLKALRSNTTATTYIRFAHEMNGNWYPWSVTASNYTYFDAAWNRYRALQQQIFPQAKLVFSLNRESSGSSGIAWTKYFPGAANVDLISVDYYNQYPYVATDADWKASLSQTDAFGAPKGLDKYLAYAQTQGLPLAVSEWSGKASFGDSPVFVQDMLQYFKTHAGNSAGHIAYDVLFNVGGYSGDYQLFGPDAKMPLSSAAYASFFQAGAGSSGSGSSTVTAPPVTVPPVTVPPVTTAPVTTAPVGSTDTLPAGTSLTPGSSLVSADGQYTFAVQTDGNLVVYKTGGPAIWNSSTYLQGGTHLDVQGDGNLVFYNKYGKALWNTATSGAGAGSKLVMQSDGNLVLYSAGSSALWNSKGFPVAAPSSSSAGASGVDTLTAGHGLTPGASLVSAGGQYTFAFQTDGNLVVYDASHRPLWNSGTAGRGGTELDLQTDSNLVLYNASRGAPWFSSTSGQGSGSRLAMQSDGNLVLYSAANRPLWYSKSN